MTDSSKLTVIINGIEHRTEKGNLVIQAAREIGIDVPVFCYHEKLGPFGCCRLCLVEVKKLGKLFPACTVVATDGMEVVTDTPAIRKARKGVLEFTLLNHPLDCPVCDKGGECPLQDNCFTYGAGESRFQHDAKLHKEKAIPLGETTVLDRERCILCQRCTRFSSIIEGSNDLVLNNRGVKTEIATFNNEPYRSLYAGNTHELCPTGALTAKSFRFKARAWELKEVPSVCVGCSQGCKVTMSVRNNRALRLKRVEDDPVSDGWLCDIGRFGLLEQVPNDSLLRSPKDQLTMLERQAADVASSLKQVLLKKKKESSKEKKNGKFAIISSSSITNEEAWLLKTFANEFDAQLACPDDELPLISEKIATVEQLDAADLMILVATELQEISPSLFLRLRKLSQQEGKTVVVIDAVKGRTAQHADYFYHVAHKDTPAFLKTLQEGKNKEFAKLLKGANKIAFIYTPQRVRTYAEELSLLFNSLKSKEAVSLPLSLSMNLLGSRTLLQCNSTVINILNDLKNGKIDALLLYKKDIVMEYSSFGNMKEILKNAKTFVVIDNEENESKELAHHTIDVERYSNFSGSIVNMEGRVQWLNNRQEKYRDGNLDLFEMLYRALGLQWGYQKVTDVTKALLHDAAFKGVSLASVRQNNSFLQLSSSLLHLKNKPKKLSSGSFSVAPLVTICSAFHDATGKNLSFMVKPEVLVLHPSDAEKLQKKSGDTLIVRCKEREVSCMIEVSDVVIEGEVALPFFADTPYLFSLTDPSCGLGFVELS